MIEGMKVNNGRSFLVEFFSVRKLFAYHTSEFREREREREKPRQSMQSAIDFD